VCHWSCKEEEEEEEIGNSFSESEKRNLLNSSSLPPSHYYGMIIAQGLALYFPGLGTAHYCPRLGIKQKEEEEEEEENVITSGLLLLRYQLNNFRARRQQLHQQL
jgi:hypothetical protein